MPWNEVMDKFKKGKLHSGSKSGPPVKKRSQALAIMLSEKEKADEGEPEYKAKKKSKKPKGRGRGFKSLPSALGKKDKLGSVPLGDRMMGRK